MGMTEEARCRRSHTVLKNLCTVPLLTPTRESMNLPRSNIFYSPLLTIKMPKKF